MALPAGIPALVKDAANLMDISEQWAGAVWAANKGAIGAKPDTAALTSLVQAYLDNRSFCVRALQTLLRIDMQESNEYR